SHQAQDGRDPTPAASPRVATRGDAFLSEQGDNTNFRYYKDGLSNAKPMLSPTRGTMGFSRLPPGSAHPTYYQSQWLGVW
ncbi:MAG: hypothetical protein AB7T18_01550, partial [Alphaproteobacteria bacterium]